MRADRLLSIVLLLQQHQHLTAKSLSSRLGVTERTIYRDIEALSMSGVPVYTRTGPDGGCFLDEGYRTSLNWFTTSELQALLYTGTASPLSELGMQHAADNAVLKLLARLPNQHHRQIDQMQQRLYLDPSSWYNNNEAYPLLPVLKDAVWQNLVCDADYETWDGTIKAICIHPYSLVYKSGRWYVVAQPVNSDDFRTYRVSRFHEVQPQAKTFERNSDFDIVQYWTKAAEQFNQRVPSYPVRLRIVRHMLVYFQQHYEGRFMVVESDDESYVIEVQYTVFEEARTSILGLGTDADVLSPDYLKTAVIDQARAIVAKYA